MTFPGNNLLLCLGEARPLFLHSVLLMRAKGARRESSRKWEGASGAQGNLLGHFEVPGPGLGPSWGCESPRGFCSHPSAQPRTVLGAVGAPREMGPGPATEGFWQKEAAEVVVG